MSATQRARSGVPLDKRSLIVTVPGLPWWGVILLAAGVTAVGVLIDATGGGGELTAVFSTFYFLGCLFAVVAASNKALFTAMAQPPLLLFAAVPIGHTLIGKDNSTALRDIAINIAYPLVNRFPIMLAATVVVLIIGGFRYFLLNQRPTGPVRSTRSRRSATSASATRDPAPETGRRRRVTEAPVSEPPRRRPPEVDEQSAYRSTPRREPIQDERPLPPRRSPLPPRVDRTHQPPTRRPQPDSRPTADDDYPSYGRRRAPEPTPSPRREERMEPFFASGDDVSPPLPPRRRPPGVDLPAYPPPRVRYRDRDEP
ncbi:DUF6542 domain-containing protein [Rhodococcus sp. IEGM 1318]|uniref:DUF6542 domain-containing protein n=1 Tax=Rhodococcus sp. IEGM 1318 TaxID=3082226 RepID=UPI002954E78A|nr:DUF6542 domain-containing protein [Rhodococcus sp. IEGM 1318]MDV8006270.1 DUF6542 domain-containing protein [Rhodococcus sp. IEGM 1318]